MTNEEAKRRLEVWLKCMDCPEDKQCYDSHLHSTCEYTDYCDETPVSEAVKVAIKALEPQPRDDAISREAVCEIISDIRDCISVEGYWAILERLKQLPPVTQKSETVTEFADRCRECGAKYGKLLEQKYGKWIVVSDGYGESAYICECSECKDTVWVYKDADRKWNYCPSCGAKMQESEE